MVSRAVLTAAFLGCFCASIAFPGAARAGDEGFSLRIDALEKTLGRAKNQIAQIYGARPPVDLDEEPAPGAGRDGAALGLRIDRLERDMRQMTGRVEELQHDILRLEDQLRAARTEGPAAAGPRPSVPAPVATTAPPAQAAGVSPAAGLRRGDAFDPAANPGAAGAPQTLGATTPSTPLPARPAGPVVAAREPGQPLDLTHGRSGEPATAALPVGASVAEAAPPAPGPRDDYEHALGLLRSGQYEAAEKGFADFLVKNPKNKLVAGATYNLGESYFLRGRHREAAERYLEISTKYAQSTLAPEAMLRLGQSLHAIGAREQACASFSEIGVKYPAAAQKVRDAADREAKKLQC